MAKPLVERYRIHPGERVSLHKFAPDDDGGLDREKAEHRFAKLGEHIASLQERLYAQGTHALLIVLQAMDCGGKDSTILHVFAPINPQGCIVHNFKAPAGEELDHDFIWRVHQRVPRKGYINVFNRSHYEDVLIVRVKNLVPRQRWEKRYDHINAFEAMLHDEGTRVVKFFLHISKEFQKQRLEKRLEDHAKWWKFNPADLAERGRWNEYQKAYEAALGRCSTAHAPWYVIPAEKRWYRNLLVAEALVEHLEAMKPRFPKVKFEPKDIVVPD